MGDPPCICVLPMSTKANQCKLQENGISKCKSGLLAWGNQETVYVYGHLFDAVLLCAAEYPVGEKPFYTICSQHKQTKFYHVPISEIPKNNQMAMDNYLSQNVWRVQCSRGVTTQTLVTPHCSSDQLIKQFLMQKKKVLVVCMAGINRSSSTLIQFLLLNSFDPTVKGCSILEKAQRPNYGLDKWEEWLKKRKHLEVYPMNRLQLELLEKTMRTIKTRPCPPSKK